MKVLIALAVFVAAAAAAGYGNWPDRNNNGVDDRLETRWANRWVGYGYRYVARDTDMDGVPDKRDNDDDNDGIPDKRDPDDDGDGIRDENDKDNNGYGYARRVVYPRRVWPARRYNTAKWW